MHLYNTSNGAVLVYENQSMGLAESWDILINRDGLHGHLKKLWEEGKHTAFNITANDIKAPVESQEVWAAGVTYLRSRDARMEESKNSGAADCYSKVYAAERPELFFKATPQRVVGTGAKVNIRKDSGWNIPEPELTLFINSRGNIEAYTVGNDMSSRSIEGENPLYLPQAKMYEGSAALGPCLYVPEKPINAVTEIRLQIFRKGQSMYKAAAPISRMKRSLKELAAYLFRALHFPHGCFLMTGTCLVPPDDFTLHEGDTIKIEIEGIGVLENTVAVI